MILPIICPRCRKKIDENNEELWVIPQEFSFTEIRGIVYVLACRECREQIQPIEKFPNTNIDWETGQSTKLLNKFFYKE